MPNYGVIGGKRVQGSSDLYKIDKVIEKPTPTQAEQELFVPGLRSGHYLCFFGMHVLTSTVIDILGRQLETKGTENSVTLSDALAQLAKREQYLALAIPDWRYDVGAKYGLLTAQLALALSGQDRDEVLAQLLGLLAVREMSGVGR